MTCVKEGERESLYFHREKVVVSRKRHLNKHLVIVIEALSSCPVDRMGSLSSCLSSLLQVL